MRKILIADDDAGQRRLMCLTLGAGDFEVLEAVDGHRALALARQHDPELVFLDWEMPGPSGIEVCRALRAAGNHAMRIVLLTGRDGPDDRRTGLEAGADDYLAKPFSPLTLLDKVADTFGPDALI
jgi:DNA-binding response OmpR family regulator